MCGAHIILLSYELWEAGPGTGALGNDRRCRHFEIHEGYQVQPGVLQLVMGGVFDEHYERAYNKVAPLCQITYGAEQEGEGEAVNRFARYYSATRLIL